jgi:hypothetical protein
MTTEQFDKLLAHLDKLANAQAAIVQGKNMGTFASDRKTDEGRVLKVVLKNWRRLDDTFAVSESVITDSFYRFSFFHNLPEGFQLKIQCLSPAGKWHFLKNFFFSPPTYTQLTSNSGGQAECGTFAGNFCAVRFHTTLNVLITPNNEVCLIGS